MGEEAFSASAEDQVRFLRNVQRLLTEGGFVATYKYALLHALADLSLTHVPDSRGQLTLTTEAIAERFIELYWRQTADYPTPDGQFLLRQNTGRQAAAVREIRTAYRTSGSLASLRRNHKEWHGLVQRVRRTVEVMPLWKLQTLGNEKLEFLFPNTETGHEIVLFPGVAFCLRAFHGLIVELVRSAWLRYIRRFNEQVRQSVELSSFLFGSERGNLAVYRRALESVDESFRCFYCDRALNENNVAVDHFVPWSRYPNDISHNFVLAHDSCNAQKSDNLADETHLNRWLRRNARLGKDLCSAFESFGLYHNRSAIEQIGFWAYEQVEAVGGQVWIRGKELKSLGTSWRSMFTEPQIP